MFFCAFFSYCISLSIATILLFVGIYPCLSYLMNNLWEKKLGLDLFSEIAISLDSSGNLQIRPYFGNSVTLFVKRIFAFPVSSNYLICYLLIVLLSRFALVSLIAPSCIIWMKQWKNYPWAYFRKYWYVPRFRIVHDLFIVHFSYQKKLVWHLYSYNLLFVYCYYLVQFLSQSPPIEHLI